MKAAAEFFKPSKKSLPTCSDEESKRNKFEKAKKQYPKIKGNKDVFCWTCHKSGNIATCSRCPRAFHLKCGHLDKVPEPSSKWICPECDIVQRANDQTSNAHVKILSQMLNYVIERMKLVNGSEDFCEPVDTNKWHDYLDYIIKPMDIPKLVENVRRHLYKSTEAFLADFRWLVHDSYVYNSVHSAYTKTAKSMSAVAKQECEEIKNCADCYLHAYSLEEDVWFIEPCTTPHVLVWAQLSGFPYWPGKVMKHVNGDLVDVRFFGDHSRANVPVTSCFLYSRLMPCTVKKNHPRIGDGIEEAERHVKKLKGLYGTFYHAQYRVRYIPKDEDLMRKLQLPGFQGPNETPEFLKMVEQERSNKMILDRDFLSEMNQLYTPKKPLVPTKRKSVDQSPKEGPKRMLVQLNTSMGPKCAVMNLSGSESDSSPKHVPERLSPNPKSSSSLNSSLSSLLKETPTTRIRSPGKLESVQRQSPLNTTEPDNEAMIKQVVATSPKELVDIYKTISPIKDTGILQSISRKLLTPTSPTGTQLVNEASPSQRAIAVENPIVNLLDNAGQNGLKKSCKGFSNGCQEDSDVDSDALVIASRESSPVENGSEMGMASDFVLLKENVLPDSGVLSCDSAVEEVKKRNEGQSVSCVLNNVSAPPKVDNKYVTEVSDGVGGNYSMESLAEKIRKEEQGEPTRPILDEVGKAIADSSNVDSQSESLGKLDDSVFEEHVCNEVPANDTMDEGCKLKDGLPASIQVSDSSRNDDSKPDDDDKMVLSMENGRGRCDILNLLDGDLSHLYDNLASQTSPTGGLTMNDTTNSESSVASVLVSSSCKVQLLDSNDGSKEPAAESIVSCASVHSDIKIDYMSHNPKTDGEKTDDASTLETGSTVESVHATVAVSHELERPVELGALVSSALRSASLSPSQINAPLKTTESIDSKSVDSQLCETNSSITPSSKEGHMAIARSEAPTKPLMSSDDSDVTLETEKIRTMPKGLEPTMPAPVLPNLDVIEQNLKSSLEPELPKLKGLEKNQGFPPGNYIHKDNTVSAGYCSLKDISIKTSNSSDQLDLPVEPIDETGKIKAVEVRKPPTVIVFTNSVTLENELKKKSAEKEEKSENENGKGDLSSTNLLAVEKVAGPSKCQSPSSSDESQVKVKPATKMALICDGREPNSTFVTIASSMSLSHLSASTSARTQPVTLKDPVPSKRKFADASSAAAKRLKLKEENKDGVASGMPRPIIIKVEPEEIQEKSPHLSTEKTTKPNIKVVELSNLMEHPHPSHVKRNCVTPKNNVPSKTIAARPVGKKNRLSDASEDSETSRNACFQLRQKMIPPFSPKRTMLDVRALIEAKKQFISAKLKDDIYAMLDEIKAEYDSHIELLTNVSDRYLQHFENTFETDKTKLYEDFKNKLRDQMDQQITEIKRKQWCANCGAEASFHCCWNHAYCGDKCQKEDWATHTQVCTQYSMSATDPYIRVSPRFQSLLEKQTTSGMPKKIPVAELIDVPVAVSIHSSPPKMQIKRHKKVLGQTPTYSQVPTISIPDHELPELPKPPPSAKSYLSAPVKRLNNGEQISFDHGKRAYRIIQNPIAQKTVKVMGSTSKNHVNTYSGPLMRLGGQNKSFALVVGSDASPNNPSAPYGNVRNTYPAYPSTSGAGASRLTSKTVTLTRKASSAPGIKKSPTVRVMEDNELATILNRNHLRDAYVPASS